MGMHMRYMILAILLSLGGGCVHRHAVLSVNVRAGEERVKTRYRYCIATRFDKEIRESFKKSGVVLCDVSINPYSTDQYAKWQPDVFDKTGIPIVLDDDIKTYGDYGRDWYFLFAGMTCFILPGLETKHEHKTWSFGVLNNEQLKVSSATCSRLSGVVANNPLPFLLFRWDEATCFENGMTWDSHSYSNGSELEMEMEMRAKAFVMATRLKDMEDSGEINDTVAANARLALSISGASIVQASAGISDSIWRGTSLPDKIEQPFEIESCEREDGRDFAYSFVLKRKGGGNVTFLEYGAIRSAFRDSIKDRYHMSHPEIDARSLVVDFTECALSDGRIKGRVAVLTLEVKTLFYDSMSRTGRMLVKIGLNQLDDARRCIRKKLEELASRNNIVIEGDKIPLGARFYTGNETLRENGLLEVEFKTE